MEQNVADFREGIYSLYTTRFGTVAELMVQKLYDMSNSNTTAFDKIYQGERVEIKFSRALKENTDKIRLANVIEQCLNNSSKNRGIKYYIDNKPAFDCNIQQVKPAEFDWLYYGLFFLDCIVIFKIKSQDIPTLPNWSDKQHRGNVSEGQFHITNGCLDYHVNHHLERIITYEELFALFN